MTKAELNVETIVPFIADIFERRGAEDYLGEPVTLSPLAARRVSSS